MVEGHGRKAYGFESRLGHIQQLGPDANAFGLYCFSGQLERESKRARSPLCSEAEKWSAFVGVDGVRL